jgi:hypothetical protein
LFSAGCGHLGGKPFGLPNGMEKYDGISRQTKLRALAELERPGLITLERRPKKSPIIHLLLTDGPPLHPVVLTNTL